MYRRRQQLFHDRAGGRTACLRHRSLPPATLARQALRVPTSPVFSAVCPGRGARGGCRKADGAVAHVNRASAGITARFTSARTQRPIMLWRRQPLTRQGPLASSGWRNCVRAVTGYRPGPATPLTVRLQTMSLNSDANTERRRRRFGVITIRPIIDPRMIRSSHSFPLCFRSNNNMFNTY